MSDGTINEGKKKSYDIFIGIIIFLLTLTLMLNSNFGGGVPKELDPTLVAEIRNQFYSSDTTSPTLIVFETSWCGVCKSLKADLKQRGVNYKTLDVESSKEAYQLYQRVYGESNGPVPVTVAGNQVIIGGQVDKIIEASKKL
jgi:glutaredoxin